MQIELTDMSKRNMSFMTGKEKTPREIVLFLKEEAVVRSFSETLHTLYPGKDMAERITDALALESGDKRENVSRKVQNWMRDEHVPKNREILFQICFALGVSEEEAGRILGMCAENGIHYRNPRELVYAFGMRKGMNYQEARVLLKQVEERIKDAPINENAQTEAFTRLITQQFREIWEKEELMDFFSRNKSLFGELHNTSYSIYTDLLKKLQKPELVGMDEEEEKYNVDQVLESYLRMQVPSSKKTGQFTLIQKVVKKYWPNQRSIIQMKNRREDVSRKALILLQLVTETFDDEKEETLLLCGLEDDTQKKSDFRLETRFQKMNLLLDKCGMSKLDPCCPFDYLVLYAMKTQEDEFMSDRMNEVVKILFSEKSSTD